MSAPPCAFCGRPLARRLVDLGLSPLANALVAEEDLGQPDPRYPLAAWVCAGCFLVQVPPVERRETIFSDVYPYFSSVSSTWREHCRRYAEEMVERLALGPSSLAVEIASNDGVLLAELAARGVEVLGIEPAASVAAAARARGVPTRERFFGRALARELAAEGRRPDLLLGNNVLAHVPDLDDFVGGLAELLAPQGTITLEFPHLLRLIEDNLFDTIYHEHFSYLSLGTTRRILEAHGLEVADVEELPTHGGSLRVFARHAAAAAEPSAAVGELLDRERRGGLDRLEGYDGLQERVDRVRDDLVGFLTEARRRGERVAGYGAPAKATTLLNYCEVGPELLAFTVDRAPAKQGRYLPGVRIPIRPPEALDAERPDWILILPWNLTDEIAAQIGDRVHAWGGRLAVALPHLTLLDRRS